jgi:hypothetical protein
MPEQASRTTSQIAVPSSSNARPTVEVTVLMPCLDEAATLGECVRAAQRAIRELAVDGEVVVADNGSTDGSPDIAREGGARVVGVAMKGYGAALFEGVTYSRGRFIVMADADGSYDFSHLERFVRPLQAGADLVIGNRFAGGILPGAMPWKNRYLGNPVLSCLGRLFFRSPVGDFHCGMRAFSRKAFDRLDLQTTGMEFASEMVIKATLLGLRIEEVPTTLAKDGRNRPPHLRPWRDGWRHLRFMLLYSPRWLFLYPGLALMVVGALVGAAVLPGPLELAPHFGLDVHTLLFACAAVLLGFQAVGFAVLARVYALNEGLLPADPILERMFRWFNLESGLLAGTALVVCGLAGAISAVITWWDMGFGALDARDTLRTAIPAAGALCLGGQVMLTSFLLSIMGLRRR